MTKRNGILIFVLLATLSAFTIVGNGDVFEKIYAQLTRYVRETPQEKVYLHFDKPYYMAGETMWYKGYLFDAIGHNVDSISRILYVDLIDPSVGKVLMHNTLKCEKGMTDGSFKLPDSLVEKIYTVRAYTNYMRNFSEDWFFYKPVKIWQTKNNKSAEYAQLADVADCTFFPEGGYLMNNVETRVAFKAVNTSGKGLEVNGVLFENEKDTVLAFKTIHAGLGYFYFAPKQGKKYTAKIKKSDGTEGVFTLPDAQENGLTLAVDNTSSRANIKVIVTNPQTKTAGKNGDWFLLAHQRGFPCFSAKGADTKKTFTVPIPRTSIPDDGIVQITLFDAEGQPRCERLIFVHRNNQINLKITPDKTAYQPREKVTLTVEATDSTGKPVIGDFSLAATDGTQVLSNKYEENLMSYLLLSSELNGKDAVLRGVVEDPAYYFDPANKAATRDLDLLMMTQGWRRFVWKDVLAEKIAQPKFLIEQGLSITGRAIRPNGKSTNKPVNVTLMIGGSEKKPILKLASADSMGNFGFYSLNFSDTTTVFVQAVKEKGLGTLNVTLDKAGTPQVLITKIPFNTMAFDAVAFADFLKTTRETLDFERKLQLNKERMLETVEIKAKKNTPFDERRIYGTPSNTLDMTKENCGSYTNILDAIVGRFAGVQVTRNGGEVGIVIRGGGSVGFRLDGMQTDVEMINTISPCDVEAIDVLKGADASIFGSTGGDGVISILTKRGNPNYDYTNDPTPTSVVVQKRQGYTVSREFYAPHYDEDKPEHEFKDFRSTLHWQPYVKTNAFGKAQVTFWNSDAKTKVNVVAEGISQRGRIGVASCTYEVK